MATRAERMKVGPARMGVRVQDWPGGNPGIRVRIGESEFQFTVEGAAQLRDALEEHISQVRPRAGA